jgi:hypothetical protein
MNKGAVGLTSSYGDDVLNASISELLSNFRNALLAMHPYADVAKLTYGDVDTHRDWERLADCIFDVFVRGPILADDNGSNSDLPLARYNIDEEDYFALSWICPEPDSGAWSAILRLLSVAAPLDTVQIVGIDRESLRPGERRVIAWDDARFTFVRRSDNGEVHIVQEISAVD